jgi:hypothetical protein
VSICKFRIWVSAPSRFCNSEQHCLLSVQSLVGVTARGVWAGLKSKTHSVFTYVGVIITAESVARCRTWTINLSLKAASHYSFSSIKPSARTTTTV